MHPSLAALEKEAWGWRGREGVRGKKCQAKNDFSELLSGLSGATTIGVLYSAQHQPWAKTRGEQPAGF